MAGDAHADGLEDPDAMESGEVRRAPGGATSAR